MKIGDVVEIFESDSLKVTGKVLYISSVYKKIILLGLYAPNRDLQSDPDHLVYTSSDSIVKGRWKIIEGSELCASQEGLALRIVGGNVYLNDQILRTATDSDYESLAQMDVDSPVLVESSAEQMLLAYLEGVKGNGHKT